MVKPKINPPLRKIDFVFETLAALCILFMVVQVIYEYPGLSEQIPTHFGGDGSPDDWGSKTSMLILPLVGIVMYGGLTAINFFPHTFNFPVEITAENAERQYQLAKGLICALKFTMTGLFLYIQYMTINVSKGLQSGLGGFFIVVVMVASFLPIVIYFIQAIKSK